MANVLAPFGFRHMGYLDGSKPNFGVEYRQIAAANATRIYHGDPVTTLNTGYIAQSTVGTTQIAGIFQSVNFQAISMNGQTRRLEQWIGSDALADGTAQIVANPYAVFVAQANGQATLAMVGQNVNFALGTGNTLSGVSGAMVDITTVATTATLPFRIRGLASQIPTSPWLPSMAYGSPGADGTTPYNYVYVTFNFQDFKSTTGI